MIRYISTYMTYYEKLIPDANSNPGYEVDAGQHVTDFWD